MVVERCGEEAKLVTIEQEAKKAAEARAKASPFGDAGARGLDGLATTPTAPAADAAVAEEPAAEDAAESDRMPGATEAVEGGAPEVMVHDMRAATSADELSPEEAAIQGLPTAVDDRPSMTDENEDPAAVAQTREPPSAE